MPESDVVHTAQAHAESSTQRGPVAKRACLPPHYKGPRSVALIPSNIPIPGGGSKVGPGVAAFFEPRGFAGGDACTAQSTALSTTSDHPSGPSQKGASAGAKLLPIPIPPLDGLTRTERFFSVLTRVHPHSLKIEEDDEFYLFARMRYERKWVSFTMTSRAWLDATTAYNDKLRAENTKKGLPTINKHPDALIAKLKVIEGMCKAKIKDGSFVSIQLGTTDFWEKQCSVVALEKPNAKPRKIQECTRCKTVKYPCGTGSPENHKLKCCSDGVKISDEKDEPPPWPQPSGIYRDGTHFHAAAFLDAVRDVYERIVVDGQNPLDLPIDLISFVLALDMRLVKRHTEDKILFKLWADLEIEGPPLDDRIVCVAGHRFLAIDPSVLVMGPGAGQLAAAVGARASSTGVDVGATTSVAGTSASASTGTGTGAVSASMGVGATDAGTSVGTSEGTVSGVGAGTTSTSARAQV